MKKCAVIGSKGFLGSALAKKLGETTTFPTNETKYLFHFGSPVHPPFEENPDYHLNEIISSYTYLLPYCRDHQIKFIYPSSALVYEKDTNFTKTKLITEIMASMYPKTLGLRIFPVYGPGETRTVIYQWCKAMKNGQRPVVYGDGTQERDFIYIDDAVNQILRLVESVTTGVRDIGCGSPISFNQIILIINTLLKTDLKPIHVDAPKDYSKGIVCKDRGECPTSIIYGIGKVLDSI